MDLLKLKGTVPDRVLEQIPAAQNKFLIDTPLRLAHFLAQCAHESCGFTATRENLNYSAEALGKTFKKYFPTGESAAAYARKPEKIANKVYGSRMGNGDEASGDGYKFCGKGYIQLTGKDNYAAFDKSVEDDIMADPGLVASKYPLLSAGWFWNKNNLNTLADKGATDLNVTTVTKRVNGGTNGLDDRIKHFKKYYQCLQAGS